MATSDDDGEALALPIRRRRSTWLAVAAVAILAAVAATTLAVRRPEHLSGPAISSSAPLPSSAPVLGPTCTPEQLDLTVGSVQVTQQTTYTTFDLTNAGPQACSMHGFPTVNLLRAGKVVGALGHVGEAGPAVAVAAAAFAQFSFLATATPGEDCAPGAFADFIRVDPPGRLTGLPLPFSVPYCVSDSVTAVSLGRHLNICGRGEIDALTSSSRYLLDGCTRVISEMTSVAVHLGDHITLTHPDWLSDARLTSSDTAVLRVSGSTLIPVAPGTATVTQSGWQCSSGPSTCPFLHVDVG